MVDDDPCLLEVYDFGRESSLHLFEALCQLVDRVHVYVFVFSIIDRHSFHQVEVLYGKLCNHLGVNWLPGVLAGTKSDLVTSLPTETCVTQDEATAMATRLGLACYVETSAKVGVNPKLPFIEAVRLGRSYQQHLHEYSRSLRPPRLSTSSCEDGGRVGRRCVLH